MRKFNLLQMICVWETSWETKKKQDIAIFTTASLPWMTGTAVNPLFRAAYLGRDGKRKITLVIPWLTRNDQQHVFPNNKVFNSPLEQEIYVRQWVEERTGFTSNFDIRFYPGKYYVEIKSIIPLGDITEVIPSNEVDVAVLEEPEHLNWYHHGKRWKSRFRYVVGIIHTNYVEYVKRDGTAFQAFLIKFMSSWVVNIYCHKVIRISAATEDLARSVVCNVHGVNPKLHEIGKKKEEQKKNGELPFTKGAYYIGKMVWSKGYRELLNLLRDYQKELAGIEVDLYGSGEDSEQVQEAAKKLNITVRVHPARDHRDPIFHDYKVLLNPSTTDSVCTTTAEALAMGKIVVCANHPSNDFYKQFSNCRTYDDGDGFVKATCMALSEEPLILTDAERHELTWEAATHRFLKVTDLGNLPSMKLAKGSSEGFWSTAMNLPERASALVHYLVTAVVGAKPDEEHRRDLGLSKPSENWGTSFKKWT